MWGPKCGVRNRMPTPEEIDWKVVSEVRASKRRTQVLKALQQQPMLNGELADNLGLSTAWVRQQVKWLIDNGLVEDLTEDKHNYKIYGITDKGEKIADHL